MLQNAREQDAMVARKATKVRTLRAIVYPQGGGNPYEQDVQPDEKGTFDMGDNLTYTVTKGSVCLGLDGIMRIIVHEGNPQSINGSLLSGDPIMHPTVFHAAVHNNLLLQQADMERSRALWKQASTYGMILIGVGLLLTMLWQVKTIGTGLEQIQHALEAIQSAGTVTPAEAGHNTLG